MRILKVVKSLLSYTPNERRGIIVLLFLLLIVIVIRLTTSFWFHPDSNGNTIEVITVDLSPSKEETTAKPKKLEEKSEKKYERDTLLKINPNTCTSEELIAIGFSRFAATNLIKYRSRGGFFRCAEDLIKIYGVEESLVLVIRSQLLFPKKREKKEYKRESVYLELNSTDTLEIQKIPFIGSVRGNRIIKYRNTLGGFYSLHQLKEVYGVDSICYESIKKHAWVNDTIIRRLSLNECDQREFASHPYVSVYQAKAIVRYRELMSHFTSVNDLKINNIFSGEEFERVEKYFSVNN